MNVLTILQGNNNLIETLYLTDHLEMQVRRQKTQLLTRFLDSPYIKSVL